MCSMDLLDAGDLNRDLDRVALIMECTSFPVRLSDADAATLFAGTAREFWRWLVHHETGTMPAGYPSAADPYWLRIRHVLASIRRVPAELIEADSGLGL